MILLWIGLFGATAFTDWLSAKYIDAGSSFRRANISAVHEIVGFLSGFVVYTWTRDVYTVIPCVLGAWVGSYLAGVDDGFDPAFVDAVHDALSIINEREISQATVQKRP